MSNKARSTSSGWLAPARSAGPAVANGRAKLVLMPSHVQPRRIIINGHPTSVRLEPAYWGWLREIAAECGLTAKAFIEGVVAAKDPKFIGVGDAALYRQLLSQLGAALWAG